MAQIPPLIHESWHPFLAEALEAPELISLRNEILPHQLFYPPRHLIFSVFQMPLDKIRVVILGQDPYPNFGQATGLSFAVPAHIKIPKSLEIVIRELHNDVTSFDEDHKGEDPRDFKSLISWFHQGVFLLNTALTVEAMKPGSHSAYWDNFTKKVIHTIANNNSPVWLLWGANAKKYRKVIESAEAFQVNNILEASHPASEFHNPGSGGFYGCRHFTQCNDLLIKKGQQAINW